MSTESITFSRTMVNYNISNTFQLNLPKNFCDVHMPSQDHEVILVDEREQEYKTMFLINTQKLGRSWRDFVIAHRLRVGDNLSFQLIDRCRFKVHITRSMENEFQNNVPVRSGKRKDFAEVNTCFGTRKVAKKHLASCVEMQERLLNKFKKSDHEEVVSKEKVHHVIIRSPNRSTRTDGASGSSYPDCLNDDDAEHTRILEKELPAVDDANFKTLVESALSLEGLEDFKIHVNGKILDSEIPQDVRMKYYQLCCGEKKLTHDRVVTSLGSKYVVAVILEIVRIADSTEAAPVLSSPHDLECMWKILETFEGLGFAVGSLRVKISTLAKSSNAHQTVEGETNSVEFSESAPTFEDFKVDVNGVTLDSEIPPDVRMRYYQLCCGENKLIHDRVMKGINSNFVVSVILEIVRIADFAKDTTVSTAPRVLESMVKILRSFEELGFSVKMLRGKIGMLLIFKDDYQKATRRISDLESDQGTKECGMSQNMGIDIDALKRTRARLELVIREAAGSTLYGRHTICEVFSLV